MNEMIPFDKNLSDKITEEGSRSLREIIDYLKKNPIDFNNLPKTEWEKIGDTNFPVTRYPNGLIIVDYP